MPVAKIPALLLRCCLVVLLAGLGRPGLGAHGSKREIGTSAISAGARGASLGRAFDAPHCDLLDDASAVSGDDGAPPERALETNGPQRASMVFLLCEHRRLAAERSLEHLRTNGQADANGARA